MNLARELLRIQEDRGHLGDGDLRDLSDRSNIPLARIGEVASFFPHFHREPPAKVEVSVCRDTTCHLRGSAGLISTLEDLARSANPASLSVHGVSCLGRCDRAPAVLINHSLYAGRTPEDLPAIVDRLVCGDASPPDEDRSNPGVDVSSWQIEIYHDGPSDFRVAREVARRADPGWVLGQLEVAELQGMGGPAVSTHKKWRDVKAAPSAKKYVVGNGDESEPGTFKDREILLHKAHLVIEGMVICALTVGASEAYVYLRDEYPEQRAAIEAAIAAFSGTNIAPALRIEVFRSPGGYICGEQTALIEAMQGHRAEPRNRPPQLETNGLFGCPTVLNNVETLAWVPSILSRGGAWYRDAGTSGYKGRRIFSISGDVARPGVYEVPIGLSVGKLIEDYAGGMRAGLGFKALAPSGPSGGFLPRNIPVASFIPGYQRILGDRLASGASEVDLFALALDAHAIMGLGLMLGAGLVVYGSDVDMDRQALNGLEFYRNETCGKCVPCRIGTQKLVALGAEMLGPGADPAVFLARSALVDRLTRTMVQTSICGLGTAAPAPLTSLLKYFPRDDDCHLPAHPATNPDTTIKTPSPVAPAVIPAIATTALAEAPSPEGEQSPYDEEYLFSRDINNQLIRLEKPEAEDYEAIVPLMIDGRRTQIRKAVPKTDSLGDILIGPDGLSTLRDSTVYDAATALFEGELEGDNPIPILCHQPHMEPVAVCRVCVVIIAEKKVSDLWLKSAATLSDPPAAERDLVLVDSLDGVLHFRIVDDRGQVVVETHETNLPEKAGQIEVLRRQLEPFWPPHSPPEADKRRIVAAVRSIVSYSKILIKWPRKLLPSCQHPVRKGMLILTLGWDPEKAAHLEDWFRTEQESQVPETVILKQVEECRRRVVAAEESVRTIAELLMADHIVDEETRPFDHSEYNELWALGRRLKAQADRFPRRPASPQPGRERAEMSRSRLIAVDHDACILCNRCIRGCADIRQNFVIGRIGKGGETRIGFDLDVPMKDSTCVECGECLISCPTGAITAARPVQAELPKSPGR